MASSIDGSTIYNDPIWNGRVSIELAKIAQFVYSEAASTPGHAMRMSLATKVLGNVPLYASLFVPIVLGSANVQASISATAPNGNKPNAPADTDIDNAISAAWNAMAGA